MSETKEYQNLMTEQVVLVDENGVAVGQAGKLEAHQKGLLHKAFSVVIFNEAGEMLLQQRALHKYHTPGLWTNACCSHPRLGEDLEAAAHRRLQEELGFDTDLTERFSFVYKFLDEASQLWEHEHDTVFVGSYDGEVAFNPEEVHSIRWIGMDDLRTWIEREPEVFTFWFRTFLPQLVG